MRKILAVILFAALFPIYAFGNFSAPRFLVSAQAQMRATEANGIYEKIRTAAVEELFSSTDGAKMIKVTLDNGNFTHFAITDTRPSRCGTTYTAIAYTNFEVSRLELSERGNEHCMSERLDSWSLQLQSKPFDQEAESRIRFLGLPVRFLLTL